MHHKRGGMKKAFVTVPLLTLSVATRTQESECTHWFSTAPSGAEGLNDQTQLIKAETPGGIVPDSFNTIARWVTSNEPGLPDTHIELVSQHGEVDCTMALVPRCLSSADEPAATVVSCLLNERNPMPHARQIRIQHPPRPSYTPLALTLTHIQRS